VRAVNKSAQAGVPVPLKAKIKRAGETRGVTELQLWMDWNVRSFKITTQFARRREKTLRNTPSAAALSSS